jgi:hypothetical protein
MKLLDDPWKAQKLFGYTGVIASSVVVASLVNLKSSRTETKVREINDSIIANIRRDTAAAEERAAEANARAAGLEVEALQLRKQLLSQGPRAAALPGSECSAQYFLPDRARAPHWLPFRFSF